LILALTLLGGLLGAFRLSLSLGQSFPGMVLLWRKEQRVFTVSWTTPPNWNGPMAGLKINDQILCIRASSPANDLTTGYNKDTCFKDNQDFKAILREAYPSNTHAVDFLIERDGVQFSVRSVPVIPFTPDLLLETFLPAFILGLAFLILGWVVYRANPGGEINLIFSLAMVIAGNAAFNTTLAGLITDAQFETGKITMLQFTPWIALSGALAFHLTNLLSNPGPFSAVTRPLHRPYYLLASVFSALGVFAFAFDKLAISPALTWAYIHWVMLSWVITGLWAFISLGYTHRRSSLRRVRRQTGLVIAALLLSILASIPFIGLFYANGLTFAYMQGIPYLGLVVVGLIAYAILRYQLFAARTQILAYLLVMVAGVMAAILIYLLGMGKIDFVPLLGTAWLTGSVFTGRFKLLKFLDRQLHREKLDYQIVARFGQQVHPMQSVERLAEAAIATFKTELETERVDLWLHGLERPALERYTDGHLAEITPLDPITAIQFVRLAGPVYGASPQGRAFNLVLPGLPSSDPDGVWAPLVDREQLLGLLYLGPRWTGEVYSEDDVRLIKLLAAQFALAIANTRQVESLQAMQRLILQAEENERGKIARELHDTVLQFLLVLTFRLDGIKDSRPEWNGQIEGWQEQISAEASRLRDLLSYLRTPETLEQRGLVAALKQLFDEMRQQTATQLEYTLDPQVEVALSTENKVALYRMLREATHNALKHALAQQITVKLHREGDRAAFSVRDNGQGFDLAAALKSTEKGYNSLRDMRIYIESTGGRLEMQSMPGEGTTIQGWVPMM
jgi:signal transduction histidine kinase